MLGDPTDVCVIEEFTVLVDVVLEPS